jgi:4-amino-4-deoxy-L-arabinose transferase-like glycosyltransferase
MNRIRRNGWGEPLAVVCIFLIGLGLRLYRLPEFPPGLHYDEAANGLDALDVLAGARDIFFERNYGREPLFIYLQAIAVGLLGATPFALRLTSAIIGAATIPAVYWMIREAFWRASPNPRWLAFWSAVFLATSYWHLNFSRIGYRAIMVPLLASLAFAVFWRSWRQLSEPGRMPWLGLLSCGGLVGLSLYTYTAARFLPILVVFVAGCDLVRRGHAPFEFRRRLAALTVIAVSALVVFSPLAAYFISHPESFVGRASQISIFSPDHNGGDALNALFLSASGTAAMFSTSGDANLRHNPAGRPILDVVTALWFLLGLAVCVRRWRSLPHLFLLAWMVVFSLPAILTASEVPHSLRALGMAPAVYTLPVVAMLAASDFAGGRLRRWAMLLPLPFFVFASAQGIGAYFAAWQVSSAPNNAFQSYFVSLASYMNEHGSEDGAWVLPVAGASAWMLPTTGDYHVQFLYRGRASYGEVVASPGQAPNRLAKVTQGRVQAYLINRWDPTVQPEGLYLQADPKNLLTFLLAKHGQYVGETDAGAFTYRTYDLPFATDYRVASGYATTDVSFGGNVSLTGYAYGRTATDLNDRPESLEESRLASGQAAWVALRWQAQMPITQDLKTTLRLTDAAGRIAGQSDDLLVSDGYPFSRTWETSETAFTYHIIPTLPALAPGQYSLYLGVYEAQSGQRSCVVSGGVCTSPATLLGSLAVTPAIAAARVAPSHGPPVAGAVAPGLGLVGYDLVDGAFSPGDRVPLTLYWQSGYAPLADYRVALQLQAADGRFVVEQGAQPIGGQFPTSAWRDGELVRDWQDLALPVTLPAGDYSLVVNIQESGAAVGKVTLGSIAVRGRPRVFEGPEVQHPVELMVGEGMRLVGYDLETPLVRTGSTLSLTLHWQAEREMDRSYTVFVHLLDGSGRVRAQQDNAPGLGYLPTTGWAPGEYIADAYEIALPVGVSAGDYALEVGVYDAATGIRLPVRSATGERMGDRIILSQSIRVAPP